MTVKRERARERFRERRREYERDKIGEGIREDA